MTDLEHRYEDARLAIKNAIARFPAEFGLKTFRDDVFRISESATFVSGNRVMLYTQKKLPNGSWVDFAKATEEELRPEIIT